MEFEFIVSTKDFMPRIHCGAWDSFHLILYMASGMAIGIAYFLIPVGIVASQRSNIRFTPNTWMLFVLFIFFCGVGHLLDDVASFIWPAYRLFAWWHAATAVVSWWAVGVTWAPLLWRIVNHVR